MVQYDTRTSQLRLIETKSQDGKQWTNEGAVVDLSGQPEVIRQLAVQLAKVVVAANNGNDPTRKQEKQPASLMDKLKQSLERAKVQMTTPGAGTKTETDVNTK